MDTVAVDTDQYDHRDSCNGRNDSKDSQVPMNLLQKDRHGGTFSFFCSIDMGKQC